MDNSILGKDAPIVDLFPYRMKNRELFYERNHPTNVHPASTAYEEYWTPFIRKCIEGNWVYDHSEDDPDNGTWVWVPGRLFRYINYARINDKYKNLIYPDLRATDWIIASYLECSWGFSGFDGDDEYTCNRLIEKIEKDPSNVKDYVKNKLPKEVYRKDGSYKKFIHPWTYITRFYLNELGHSEPLGKPLYQNPLRNSMIGSARGVGKSLSTFVMDLEHNIQFCGVNRWEDLDKINRRKLITLAGERVPQLRRSINALRNSYYNAPGRFEFTEEEVSTKTDRIYYGPLYKKLQGSWDVGSELNHLIKDGPQTTELQGVGVQMVALTPDKLTIAAGDRMDVYVEEAFFVDRLLEIHANLTDSLQVDGVQVSRVTYLGTGGEIKSIREPMALYLNPGGYNIFGIPDYWSNNGKEIGLFIPKTYAVDEARDENGNVDLEMAFEWIMDFRKEKFDNSDSVSFNKEVQFNPITPMEMLQPSGHGFLPKKEAQQQLIKLDNSKELTLRHQVGTLTFSPNSPRKVKWERDLIGVLEPIVELRVDDNITTKEGAVNIYEQPPPKIPEDLFWVIYDPAAKAGDGESFHAAIVYKWQFVGSSSSLSDTIVADWIGRKLELDANYEEVIKLSLYYNAKIFVETNTTGFVDYCRRQGFYHLLEGDAYQLERELSPNHKRSFYRVGVNMTNRLKIWAEKKLPGWLTGVREKDPETGAPIETTMDYIYCKRALHEIVAHTPNGNFDVYSCLLILMVLINKIESIPKPNLSTSDLDPDYEDIDYIMHNLQHAPKQVRKVRNRPKILDY